MWSVIALVVASLAFVVGSPAGVATTQSGIRGTVIKSPTKPVCEEGIPCSAPAAGVMLVFVRDGLEVGRATTLRNGSFRAVLPSGTYVVRTLRKFPFGGARPVKVYVRSGRFTVVSLAIDTGIR